MMGDQIFDNYLASTLPAVEDSPEHEFILRDAGVALLDKIGPSIVVTHSQGGLAGWSWSDARSHLVKGLIQLEPKGPPFREAIFSAAYTRPWGLSSIPLTYEQLPESLDRLPSAELLDENGQAHLLQAEPARKLSNLCTIPILIVTAEASYHALYDHVFVKFLHQAGCEKVEHLELGQAGIQGNGHLMFMENNSDTIAAEVEKWISKIMFQ
jgi:pimeloyl-ACP methyl ester carboxylesterase